MCDIEKPPLVSSVDRRHARKRVLFSGKISYGDGAFSLDCTIRDISESGARIAVKGGVQVPSDIYFIDLRGAAAYEAQVVWRQGQNVGLKFLRQIDLENPPGPLLHLQRLWKANAPR